jgi:elongator complex protein 1
VFVEAKSTSKALIAHEKALEWQELFNLASLENMPEDDLASMAYRVAGRWQNTA